MYVPDREIFRSQGFCGGNLAPSDLFDQHFVRGNVDYVGRVNRFVPMKEREVMNSSFSLFCSLRGIPIPSGYRMVFPNLQASYKSVAKYDKAQPVLDEGAWLLAGEWMKSHFFPIMCGSHILDQSDVLSEMDMTTSCGFPWSLKYQNKREMLANEQATAVLGDYWQQIAEPDCKIVPIWTVSQKVELRSVEKLEQNSLRTFTASAIEQSVSTNRLCLDMNNKFYAGAGRTWSAVGRSKFLQGWDHLYRRLDRHPNAFELDETAYDSSLFAQALMGVRDFRWGCLVAEERTPVNWRRMEHVYDQIVHSYMVTETGEVLLKHTGNPSGSPNTVTDNTLVLFRLFAYAWIVLHKKNFPGHDERLTLGYFLQNVEAALYGDDNTFTCSDDCVSWFNPRGIAPVWSGIGVITKTPCDDPRKLREVSFLSNGFSYDEGLGVWLPVPEENRVLSSLMWGSAVDDVRWHLLRACALRLDSYGNVSCRRVLQDYIEFLMQEYSDQLVGSVNDVKVSDIMQSWKSDSFIEALYTGWEKSAESGAAGKRTGATLIELLDIVFPSFSL